MPEFTDVLAAIPLRVNALAMLLTILPFTDILFTIGPYISALTMTVMIPEFTGVLAATSPCVSTLAIEPVALKSTNVLISFKLSLNRRYGPPGPWPLPSFAVRANSFVQSRVPFACVLKSHPIGHHGTVSISTALVVFVTRIGDVACQLRFG